ncbi:type II toxin-antitoxin system HipA family toxin [Brevundimonas bacteroides]|uniref:type II toxin-antitoxin system HipA family toxin n=1 Tax=Brevundimonas bacteroides TaxID=74311 RepID=UPI0004965E2C|nr:type II toxin-antitoxin system HipA family toxin [Brevundimonas bacteroides]
MKLAPGTPLTASLTFNEDQGPLPVGRLAMAGGLAQLEWSPELIAAPMPVSALLYPPEPGLHPARGRDFDGLHGFLSDSLPEGWGYLVMRRRLSKLGVAIETLSALDRLALVGDHGRGALTYRPPTAPPPEVDSLDLDALAAESTAILAGEEGDLADTLATLAGGSGGARPKVHVGFDAEGRISVSDGETAAGHEAWIVKFAATNDPPDIGPIEAAYAAMALAAGLTMAPYRLLPSKTGPGYFATRRFDRPEPVRRLHMVSLSGAVEVPWRTPASYDLFLRATLAITRHADDLHAAFRRMVFNVLASNRDDHTRQHSYLMDETGGWRLAPAYDLTYSAGPGGEHYLDVEGEGKNPTREQARSLGRRHGLPDRLIDTIIDEVRAALGDWARFAEEAGVTKASRAEIAAALKDVAARFSP